ncbi:(d)CMP kinase [Buchnera aphidicola (Mollitrichosiphum nigrofasciatum)]
MGKFKFRILYRLLALEICKKKIVLTEKSVCKFLKKFFIYTSYEILRIKMNTIDNYTNNYKNFFNTLSIISQFAKVRKLLLSIQREFVKPPGLIAEGRDMGTLVFSNAVLKFFLDANLEHRAYRRKLELQKKGFNVNFEEILLNMWERDNKDSNRKISPLIPAKNAIILDSTFLNFKQIFNIMMQYIKKNTIIRTIMNHHSTL